MYTKRQLFKESVWFSLQCHSNEQFDGLRNHLITYPNNNKHPTNPFSESWGNVFSVIMTTIEK